MLGCDGRSVKVTSSSQIGNEGYRGVSQNFQTSSGPTQYMSLSYGCFLVTNLSLRFTTKKESSACNDCGPYLRR